MGILSRFTDIMSANINSVLSKAESKNADKLLEKYLLDAKDSLGQAKAEAAAVIAEEMAISRKLSENDELSKKYEGYAAAALKSQNEDDARKFIAYQMELEQKKNDLSKQYAIAKENSDKMRQMTNKLTNDIQEAQAKLDEAKQKLTMAKQQENLNKFNEKFNESPLGNFDNLLDKVQKRVDTAEAAASLQSSAERSKAEIEDLAQKYEQKGNEAAGVSIEDRLAQLKANVNG